MNQLEVDARQFQEQPTEDADGPLIPLVVSLTFPGMTPAARELQESFARIAFDTVRDLGGRPRLVDSSRPGEPGQAELLVAADAVIFLGGGDVAGACYGYSGPAPDNEYGVDEQADEFCLATLRDAIRRDLPTLAICRGSQLLAVACGGTLIPDIGNWSLHRGHDPLFIDEEVLLEPDSHIAGILGRNAVTVRNGHHQAVATIGPELRVTARAHDGIIEGTEHRTASWIVGVQWHPEEPKADQADRVAVFSAVVARADARRVAGLQG